MTEWQEAATDAFFCTGTQFFNAAPMAAAKATLLELHRVDAARQMNDVGAILADDMVKVASQQGYELALVADREPLNVWPHEL